MGQFGLFDADKRLAALSAKGDPLEAIDRLVPWESFRVDIEAVVLTPDEMRKSSAGRKPLDAIVMFRMLVLQALNNLSDEQVEYMSTSRTPGPSFWSRTISTSIARRHSTKPSRPPKPGGWSSASNGTTPQSTAVGSIWRSPNSASYRPSASTAGFPIKEPSSRKSPPGSTTAMPTTPKPTGTSQPPMLVSNSSIFTLQSD